MEKKSTTLEKQRALAASLGGGKPATPAAKPAAKATKKAAAKKAPKKAKKAAKKKAAKTKPIGARIKVIKSTKPKAAKKAAPKAAKKAATKAAKPAKPSKATKSGQSAGSIRLECANLNSNEVKVIEAMRAAKQPMTLVEIAKAAFPRKTRAQGNSWVRNAMRRLVRGALVTKVDRGTYKVSPKGQGEDKDRPQVLAESPPKVEAVKPAPESTELPAQQQAS